MCPKSHVKSLMDFKKENPQLYLHFSEDILAAVQIIDLKQG